MDPLQVGPGLWRRLTPEQQKAALEYSGEETIMPADAPRRARKVPRPTMAYRAARRNACIRLYGEKWSEFQRKFGHKWQTNTRRERAHRAETAA